MVVILESAVHDYIWNMFRALKYLMEYPLIKTIAFN